MDSDEVRRAAATYPGERFDAGIGEHFAAARELVRKLRNGLSRSPHGFAVAVAALDWRRAGFQRPIRDIELRQLYAICLARFHPLLRPTDGDFSTG
jgi:hypothetical protein